jgi:hypothetical protein
MGNKKIKVHITHSPGKPPGKTVEVSVDEITKNIDKVEETFSTDQLRELIKLYALTAVEFYNDKKYKLAERHAMACLILCDKLESNRRFRPSEMKYVVMGNDIVELCKSQEDKDKNKT